MAKVILFEINEVPWRVIDDYVRCFPGSHIARALSRSDQYTTTTDDTLSPWTTWPSLHRGVPETAHNITDFNQELDEVNDSYPPLWHVVNLLGISTGVCGSLHSYPVPDSTYGYSFYIPDPFAKSPETHPPHVESFQSFNLRLSRTSGRNVSKRFPWREAVKAVLSGPKLGIRPSTAFNLGRHLIDERIRKWPKVRRRTWQTILAFDIFLDQLHKEKPGFSTFFTNHVASTMHRYWAAYFPEDYDTFGYSENWVETYRSELHFTMTCLDSMVGDLMEFMSKNPGYELWVASSMGQGATDADPARSQVYLKDISRFMEKLGFSSTDYEERPAMLPRVILSIVPEQRAEFAEKTRNMVIADGYSIEVTELESGVFRIHPGVIQNLDTLTLSINGEPASPEDYGFENTPIEDQTGQNAYHIPEGALWVYRGEAQRASVTDRREVSLLDVAPSILSALGLRSPDYMKGTPIQKS